MKLFLLMALLPLLAITVSAQEGFKDHGVGAPVAESRGVVAAQDADGHGIAVVCSLDKSPRGWILVTDIDTGETQQLYYPEGVPNSPPFASLLSKNGRFYTLAGKTFLELDISKREWLFHGVPAPSESAYCGSAMVDGPDGRIYGGSYPNCRLVSYDPDTGQMADHGQLDPKEHYVNTLVADSTGWLYAGIGTARQNVVACNPQSGEIKQIAQEEDRVIGSGHVQLGKDGKVYGRVGKSWYRLFEGNAEKIEKGDVPASEPTGAIGWGLRKGTFPDGRKLLTCNLPERWMDIRSADGTVKRITFDYESEGADITSVAVGPGGRIYASSCHPMHFVAYDPKQDSLEDWGPVPRVGGGNFCAMAAQGPYLFGAAYCGGFFYQYDTRKPWNNETGDDPNPRLVKQFERDITRPRACLAHPDGRHVMMSGFAGYGLCGGGLGIYDIETGDSTLITHENLVPNQSTIALGALPDGNIVGGTSIATPGGGHPLAKEGVLYILDWATKKVVFQTVPVPGASEVFSIQVGPDGLVYGIATGSRFFVFDPKTREVVHTEDWSQYGGMPRHVFTLGADGSVYAALTGAILKVQPGGLTHTKLATPPGSISAGVAFHEGRLYFGSRSHLWSYDLSAAK